MAKGIPLKTISKLITKAHLGTAVAGTALDVVSQQSKEKFGYDFLGLGMRLIMFYGLAFLIEWYMKGKIFIDNLIQNPQQIPSQLAASGFFGIGGFIIDFLVKQFLDQEAQEPDKTFTKNALFSNATVIKLFSDEGLHGFRYWDIIKIITVLLVLMEWNRFNSLTKATGGSVSALTHGMFLLFIVAIGLTLVPDLLNKLKTTDFNLASFK